VAELVPISLSRRMQSIEFRLARLKLLAAYSWRLKRCGRRTVVLRPLFWTPELIALGDGVVVWPGCRIEGLHTAEQAPLIDLEAGVTVQQNCHITAAGTLRIGAGTTILSDVVITDIDHGYEEPGVSPYLQAIRVTQTSIGTNCLIGAGARVLAGTVLGDQCVIGANTVVRGTYPARTVIAGNPARVVRQFDAASGRWVSVDRSGNAREELNR